MHRKLPVLAVLVIAFVASASGQEFKPYASSAGQYKILFPGAVKTEIVQIPVGKDTRTLTLDSVELKGEIVFMVSYIDTSEEVAKQPPGPRLDKIRDGNKGPRGKILDEKEVIVGGEKYPARDVLIETPDGFIRNRIVIAGTRLYQVMVQGSKELVTSSSADKFIESFEVTK